MPQKRNPDVAELIRGKTGRLAGNLTALLTVLKGLPGGYNRDLQEDKEAVFDTVDTLRVVLPALAGALAGAAFLPEKIQARLDPGLLATDLADVLVARGMPFRESHDVVGAVVLAAERAGVPFTELSPETLSGIHPLLDSDALAELSWEGSVERRAAPGGTARAAVEAQLREIGIRLEASARQRRQRP
jgi:argininosuccinate lyase